MKENIKPQDLGSHYENGQSDAEKLMRRHLQTPGHVVTDADLKNINVGTTDAALAPTDATPTRPLEETTEETDTVGPDRIITPLNVLGS